MGTLTERNDDSRLAMKIIGSTVLLAGFLALAGCNTIEGAGEDVQDAGDAVSDTAEDVAN